MSLRSVEASAPKRPELHYADSVDSADDGADYERTIEYYDPEEADAYIDWQAELIRDLLRDHQRIEPHHADLCGLCKLAEAACRTPDPADPAPYCSYGHKTEAQCDCGPIAENE